MRKWIYVPMILICLLSGCGKQSVQEDSLERYRQMERCEMEARIGCDQFGTRWEALLQCAYDPEGQCIVEVLEPETIAGVRAIIEPDTWYLEYEGHCLNAGALSDELLSPAECLPRIIDALRSGWLLEENREEWEETPCRRVMLDQTGKLGNKIQTTCWLKEEDGTPLRAEIAVDGEIIFDAEFTQFAFYDKIENT